MAVFIEYGSTNEIVKLKQADAVVKPYGVDVSGLAVLEDRGENNKPCRYVISVKANTPGCLKQCYSNIILAAESRGISSVVMPLLGSECGSPLFEILGIATKALYLSETKMDLYLVISKSIQDSMKNQSPNLPSVYGRKASGASYNSHTTKRPRSNTEVSFAFSTLAVPSIELLSEYNVPEDLADEIMKNAENMSETRGERVKEYFDKLLEDGITVDTRYNWHLHQDGLGYMSKQTFYDIVSGKREPTKDYLILSAWAFELDYDGLKELLRRGGFRLDNKLMEDRFCIYAFKNGKTIEEYDAWLIAYNLPQRTFAAKSEKNRNRAQRSKMQN